MCVCVVCQRERDREGSIKYLLKRSERPLNADTRIKIAIRPILYVTGTAVINTH